ncbi:MAG: UDP-galactopyranose mutase [Candidatus Gastranaerophilaceae bacterium]
MKNIIVGAGLSGAVIANSIAENLGEKVIVIDKRDFVGGNIYDYVDEQTHIHIHRFGPHIFHTNSQRVWEFLSKFTDWHKYSFEPKVVIKGKKVTLPFNLNTIKECFEPELAQKYTKKLVDTYGMETKIPILELKNTDDEDLKFIADFVYKYVFEGYTVKQWGLKPEEIDKSITARVPVFISYDNRYFQDKYQAIPKEGYTSMVKNMLNHKNIEVRLNTEFEKADLDSDTRLFYTGPIDEYFDYKYGQLPYRSLTFGIETKDVEFYQPAAMVNYPCDNDFTRITEHKHFLGEKSEKTVISKEYSHQFELGKNERFYPISNPESAALYQKYSDEAKNLNNVYFYGRLGAYKYYNMDQAVLAALELFDLLL